LYPVPRLLAFTSITLGLFCATPGCGSDSGDDAGAAAGAGASAGAGGSSGSPGAGGGSGASAGGSAGAGGAAACQEDGDLDLNGTWLMRVRLDVSMKSEAGAVVQVCPDNQKGPSDLLLIVKMGQSGLEISSIEATLCSFTLPEVTAFVGQCDPNGALVKARVEASKALLATLPGVKPLPIKGKLGGAAAGASFEPDRFVYTLGSRSTGEQMATWKGGGTCDNSAAPLGTGKSCEAMCVSSCDDVVDADGDMFPGISLTVCGFGADESVGALCNTDDPSEPGVTLQGHAGINFQVDPQLTGTAESSCLIKGKVVDAKIVYNILGADVRLAGSPLTIASVIQAIPKFVVSAETSTFQAVRIDGKHGALDLKLAADNPQAACEAAINNKNIF
jgi:hypothetical protein